MTTTTDPTAVLGRRLRQARDRAGITRRLAGKLLGVTAREIEMIERGRTTPSLNTLVTLGHLYRTPFDYLAFGIEPATFDAVEPAEAVRS